MNFQTYLRHFKDTFIIAQGRSRMSSVFGALQLWSALSIVFSLLFCARSRVLCSLKNAFIALSRATDVECSTISLVSTMSSRGHPQAATSLLVEIHRWPCPRQWKATSSWRYWWMSAPGWQPMVLSLASCSWRRMSVRCCRCGWIFTRGWQPEWISTSRTVLPGLSRWRMSIRGW